MLDQLSEKTEHIDQNIRIGVRTVYLPQISSEKNNLYAFGYFIEIQNLTSQKIQLLDRKWDIYNDKEEVKKIAGEGVVGKQPILTLKETFCYNSWVQIATPAGKMQGSYTMQDTLTKKEFVVRIPVFYLIHPQILH